MSASSMPAYRAGPIPPSSMTRTPASGPGAVLIVRRSAAEPVWSQDLDDRRVGHAAALAHRLEPPPAAGSAQMMDQGSQQPRPRASERMPERDRAALWVDEFAVGAGLGLPSEDNRGECLVDLERVDIADAEPGPGQDLLGGRYRAGKHGHRIAADHSHRVHTRQWRKSVAL